MKKLLTIALVLFSTVAFGQLSKGTVYMNLIIHSGTNQVAIIDKDSVLHVFDAQIAGREILKGYAYKDKEFNELSLELIGLWEQIYKMSVISQAMKDLIKNKIIPDIKAKMKKL